MKLPKILVFMGLCAVMASCSTSKALTYLQDTKPGDKFSVAEVPELKAKPGDRLDIFVTCKNPQLALPFNVVGGVINMDLGSNGDGLARTSLSSSTEKGYLVDAQGNIDFPVLGTIHIGGMTLTEIKNYIATLLIERNYIKDPIITVNLLNFRVTVIGETRPTEITVNGNSLNIFQLIARTNDLSSYALRTDVRVIRTTDDGCREVYSLNLKSKDVFNSPAFNLQQNDMVYVMPKGTKLDGSTLSTYLRVASTVLSAFATISTVLLWAKSYSF